MSARPALMQEEAFINNVACKRQLQVITACIVLVDNSATIAGFKQEVNEQQGFKCYSTNIVIQTTSDQNDANKNVHCRTCGDDLSTKNLASNLQQ